MRGRALPARLFLALALLLASGVPTPSGAETRTEEWVVLRIHQAGGDITVEAPRQFVSALSESPSGVTLPFGYFKGKPARMSADRLVRLLRDSPGGGKESLLLTRQTDQGPVSFYARSARRAIPPRGGMPLLLAFDMTRRGGSPLHLVLPLVGSATLGKTLMSAAGFQPDSDVGPLLERGLECAKAMGTGAILHATASDAEIAVALQ
jgi:hypothetical protein